MKVSDLIKQLETLHPDAEIEFSTACIEPGTLRANDIIIARDTEKNAFVLEIVQKEETIAEWIGRRG